MIMSSHGADLKSVCNTDSRGASEFTADVLLTSPRCKKCLGVGKSKKQGQICFSLSFTSLPAPQMFWPCDKCFKLDLIMRVTEEEMEASADRQDEWSIYFGWFP